MDNETKCPAEEFPGTAHSEAGPQGAKAGGRLETGGEGAFVEYTPWARLFTPAFHFYFFNVYLSLRERQRWSMSGGGAERGGDTESEAGSRL